MISLSAGVFNIIPGKFIESLHAFLYPISMTESPIYPVFLTTARGLENVAAREAVDITGGEVRETRAGVSLRAPLGGIYRLCLESRSINRILVSIGTFTFSDPEDIRESCRKITWTDHFDVSVGFAVDCTVTRNRGINPRFGVLTLKDAIVDTFRERTSKRPDVRTDAPGIRFNLHIDGTEAAVSIDFAGGSLHRRGYRTEGGTAGLKETLAAGILLKAGWNEMVRENPDASLVDPMCGSGTFPVEAALIAADTAPGLLSVGGFGFEHWKNHDEELYRRIRTELTERQRKPGRIIGYDRDKRAVAAAWNNAGRAGLEKSIHFERRELHELSRPAGSGDTGLVVVNPPYGRRLEEREHLPALYQFLGRVLKAEFSGWRAAVLAPEDELGRALGLKAFKVSGLYNGEIPCKLVQIDLTEENTFHIYLPPLSGERRKGGTKGRGGKKGDTGGEEPAGDEYGYRDNTEDLFNRLVKNGKTRKKYLKENDVTCYRLYDADIPEYAAAVDVYENRWLNIQEYAPPARIDAVKAQRRLLDIVATCSEATGIPAERIFLKRRNRQRGSGQYGKIGDTGAFTVIHEGGLRFLVNFSDYLDTGIFLDHRITRDRIRREAKGKRFLNLFCYTGTATVYAAAGGAVSSVSVDASAGYLDWARKNLALNDLSGHTLVQDDCTEYLAKPGPDFDLIFIDPPTFSNSKSRREDFSVQEDHEALIRSAVRRLEPGGKIIFSTNFRKFTLSEGLSRDFSVAEITDETLPPDFDRNRRIHRCFEITP
jgi:23S rRNA (guanine2445-N2)-methyltransferase / 23S rRNA (guanine2069-N7)-methyltransferase